VLYKLSGGDFTKFAPAKKMKVSDAGIFFILMEKENFMQWYFSSINN